MLTKFIIEIDRAQYLVDNFVDKMRFSVDKSVDNLCISKKSKKRTKNILQLFQNIV